MTNCAKNPIECVLKSKTANQQRTPSMSWPNATVCLHVFFFLSTETFRADSFLLWSRFFFGFKYQLRVDVVVVHDWDLCQCIQYNFDANSLQSSQDKHTHTACTYYLLSIASIQVITGIRYTWHTIIFFAPSFQFFFFFNFQQVFPSINVAYK